MIVVLPGFSGLGVTAVTTGTGFWRLMVTEALAVESCWLTAVTRTAAVAGKLAGAVYAPVAEIVPVVALPPVTPLTIQVTS